MRPLCCTGQARTWEVEVNRTRDGSQRQANLEVAIACVCLCVCVYVCVCVCLCACVRAARVKRLVASSTANVARLNLYVPLIDVRGETLTLDGGCDGSNLVCALSQGAGDRASLASARGQRLVR